MERTCEYCHKPIIVDEPFHTRTTGGRSAWCGERLRGLTDAEIEADEPQEDEDAEAEEIDLTDEDD